MVDKILGSNADVTNLLFTMTEGIGKPLRPVDGTTGGGGTVTIVQEELLRAQSFVTQQPGALNTPITVTFGDAQTTPTWDLSAGGIFTCNETGVYEIAFSIDADNLVHNTTYIFEPVINGVTAAIRAIIVGSNQVFSQSTSFIMMGNANAGDTIGINSSSTGNDAYNIQNCQLSVRRI